MKKLILAITILTLQACGAIQYKPETYEISAERIQDFPLSGTVTVSNDQPDKTPTAFFDSGAAQFMGTYNEVSEHMAKQLSAEISKHGQVQSSSGQKTISVKITRLHARQHIFHFTSEMNFTVKLGNGETLEKFVSQGSPANMYRVLNGTIALGVIEILKDPQVLNYLAQ